MARLAAQLQDEANTKINTIRTEAGEAERRQAAIIHGLRQKNEAFETTLRQVQAALVSESALHEQTSTQLQQALAACQAVEQQVIALKERLDENEGHRQSLEDKHQHAREALEHYRASVKEQRDHDIRRHEQQVQGLQTEMRQLRQSLVVKQEEVTRLNHDGVRLVAEISHAQQALYEQQTRARQTEQKLELLHTIEQRNKQLESQVDEKDVHLGNMRTQIADLTTQISSTTEQLHQRQIELAILQAKLETHEALSSELRSYLDREATSK